MAGATERSVRLRAQAELVRRQAAGLRRASQSERARAASLMAEAVERVRAAPVVFGAEDHGFSLRLPRLPEAVGLARAQLARWLADNEIAGEDAFAITLACSEACANAVEHPLRPQRQAILVSARRAGQTVELRIRDYGAWKETKSSDTRGRGLTMLEELMDSSEIRSAGPGSEIRMRRRIRSEAT